jgi:hypothetical protein
MAGFLLHAGSILRCSHSGEATPVTPNPRVTVSGQPILSQNSDFVIAGCGLAKAGAPAGRCVTARFVTAASRVRASGVPVLLDTSQAVCMPTGTPLHVIQTQTRVTAT